MTNAGYWICRSVYRFKWKWRENQEAASFTHLVHSVGIKTAFLLAHLYCVCPLWRKNTESFQIPWLFSEATASIQIDKIVKSSKCFTNLERVYKSKPWSLISTTRIDDEKETGFIPLNSKAALLPQLHSTGCLRGLLWNEAAAVCFLDFSPTVLQC